ncbi:MAG TPA: amidohydrolase [Blastocatellia bacterium]|nr:amidohydrolase [Blastocatellia bacterium]HMV86924.1 amidohydrolase [Blastocatellia bacterium]HMX25169.1 amidohydrolase [Blastocatellia bacterium]HMZ19251.1 amidohydrolase [Blastocatellia bacterium]HNG33260.1 amidohydrolase [Blastocatellia bacterium]
MKFKTGLALFILLTAVSLAASFAGAIAAQGETREREIAQAAESLRQKLIEQRRDFHINPELSNREERTAKVVAERLRALGLDEVKTGVGKHGVVALLKGKLPGDVVAVRADMDALPIQETIDVPYKSKNPGVKHACGHDVHTTVQLGVAETLSKMRDRIRGTVKFIFQPAEEGAPAGERGGAPFMIEEGCLENPHPSAIFGLHTLPTIEVGQIAYNSGPSMASSDRFTITVRGKKVHGAYPHDGVDTVVVAAECVTALQTIRSRRINTQEPLVITIGSIHGGNRYNIIADEVKMEGTMRTLNEEVRANAIEMMKQTLAGVTSIYGGSYEIEFGHNNPVTYNDPALVEATLPVMKRIVGEKNLVVPRPQMGAEDFSAYQKVIPGFFYFLGVGNKAKGITAMYHTPEFDVDEECLVVGVKVMANVLLDYLDGKAGKR